MTLILCPHCAQSLQLPEDVAGKTIRCPKCEQTFLAPAVNAAAVTEKAPTATATSSTGMTEKGPPPSFDDEPAPLADLTRRPRRDRHEAASGSSATIVILIVLGVLGLSVCGCGAFGLLTGMAGFFVAARDAEVMEQAAVNHVHEEADRAFDMEMRAKDALDKARAVELERQKLAEQEFLKQKELDELKKKELEAKPEHGEQRRLKIPENRGDVRALSFTADGSTLFAATRAESVHSWDLATWEVRTHALQNVAKGFGDRQVDAAVFTPKGDRVYFGKHGGSLSWHDLTKDPAPQATMQIGDPGRGFAFNHIALARDGVHICTGHGDSVAFVWNINTRAKVATLKDFNNQVHSAAFQPKGNLVAAGAEDVQLAELNGLKLRDLKGARPYSFSALQFSPDERFLSGVNGNTLYHWNLQDMKAPANKLTYDQRALHLAYSPDGRTLAVAVHFTRIYFYDAEPLRFRFLLDLQKDRNNWDSPHAIAYHPDGNRFAVARGTTIYLFDLRDFDKGKG